MAVLVVNHRLGELIMSRGFPLATQKVVGSSRNSPSLPGAASWKCKVTIYAVRSRGQTRTSNEAIIQHAIITAKPVLNDPVR
jgi:hypothetical protein